jgi:quercetin dioxygenase-like cupin family protein
MSRDKNIASISRKALLVAAGLTMGAGVALGAFLVAPALATPGSGFAPQALSTGLFAPMDLKADKTGKWDLMLKTKDSTIIGVDKLTVAGGGQSGWHTHTGVTLVTITVGSVKWTDGSNCGTTIYQAGDSFVEPANRLHLVRNASASDTAEFIAIQLRPEGTGARIDAVAPVNNCDLS